MDENTPFLGFTNDRSSRNSNNSVLLVFFSMSLFSLVFILIYTLVAEPAGARNGLVLLISLDGTKPEYLRRNLTPTLTRLITDGGFYISLEPSFPSVTFTNHVTLSTGLHPESHAIVGNRFYDPHFNESFSYTNPLDNKNSKWWDKAEPIWITLEKSNIPTATCFWPGSEASYENVRPSFYKNYSSVGVDTQLEWIFEWLDAPKPPKLVTLYISQIDHSGHEYGPNSDSVNQTLVSVDNSISDLLDGLKKRNLYENTDIVIVSDHGMAQTDTRKVVFLRDIIKPSDYTLAFENGPVISLHTNSNFVISNIRYRTKIFGIKKGFSVWFRTRHECNHDWTWTIFPKQL